MKNILLLKFRWPIIILTVVVAVAFGLAIPSIRIEPDIKSLIPDRMPSKVNTDRMEELFGGSDMVVILLGAEDVLEGDVLNRLSRIESGFSSLEMIERSMSLFTLQDIKGLEGMMVVDPAIPFIPTSSGEKEELREILKSNDLVMGTVISEDFRYAAIIGSLKKETDNKLLMQAIDELVESSPGPGSVQIGGYPVVAESITANIMKDLKYLLPLAIVLILLILFLSFRDFKGVFLPLSVVFMSILITVGLMPLIGWKFALVTVLLPIMLIAIGNNYGIYLVNKYLEIIKHNPSISTPALLATLSKSLDKPILLCALTTIAGILGLLAHIIIPAKQVGVLAAIGIGLAVVISLTFIPALLSLMPRSKIRVTANKPHTGPLERLLTKTGRSVTRKPALYLTVMVIITLLVGSGILRLTVEGNTVNFFQKNNPVRLTANLIDEHFGGSQSISILFTGDIKDPELLNRMDDYEQKIVEKQGVGQVMSIASVIRLMSTALLPPNDPNYDRIPETREGVAQYLELYSLSGDPSDFEQLVDFNYEHAQLMVRIDEASSGTVLELSREIKKMTKDDPNVEMIGGIGLISAELTDSLVKGQWRSSAFAIIVVCLLVGLIFRTYSAGLIVLVPLGMACIILFGMMGWLGIPFDPATVLITSVMIGCGVDYSVQYLWRQRAEAQTGLNPSQAVITTLSTTGKAICFNALAVMVGFSPLLFSTFNPIRFFGLMMLVSIFCCLVGALLVIPAVNMLLNPKFLINTVIPAKAGIPNII
ncbi:MAG: MMPL family transporter, partial [Bacteroidales bacterium]